MRGDRYWTPSDRADFLATANLVRIFLTNSLGLHDANNYRISVMKSF